MTVSEQATSVGDDAVIRATGRSRTAWHDLLSTAGAHDWSHADTAAWLTTEHNVDGWWAQGIAVGYEQHTGRRKPGQRADGRFEASVTRRVPLDQRPALEAVVANVSDEVGADPTSIRTPAKHFTAKWKREGGVITARVAPTEAGKSSIALIMTVASAAELGAAKALLTSWLPGA
jgi:hypothetical protein